MGRATSSVQHLPQDVLEGLNIDDIYDIIAFRVVVDTFKECTKPRHHPTPPTTDTGKFSDYIASRATCTSHAHKIMGTHGEKVRYRYDQGDAPPRGGRD
jgi:hypothetical protein